jgi:hypothetical protein
LRDGLRAYARLRDEDCSRHPRYDLIWL